MTLKLTPTPSESRHSTYVLKDIPAPLWAGVKKRAHLRRETVKEAMVRMLTKYAEGKR